MRAEQAIRDGDLTRARAVIDEILALQKEHELDLPDEFHFRYAKAAFSAGSIQAAIGSVNQYLTASGRDGEFYREALELLDEAEQNLPENVADRYLLRADRLMAEEDHEAALEVMREIGALQNEHDLTLPDEFHFKYAQAAFSAGSNKVAIDSVNQYLTASGRDGEFYREAMELLDEANQELLDEASEGLPEMVEIPGGRFRMGCVSGKRCDGDEKPVHEVRIRPFMLSKYEVTFEEYDRFTDATGRPRMYDAGLGRGRRPVINVSWTEAQRYVAWLSAETDEPYRLPSEAEWEYAARAGSTTQYSWGMRLSKIRPTAMAVAAGGTMRQRLRWVRSAPTPGAFTTCTAMRRSGCRTAGMGTTRVHRRTVRPGKAATVKNVFCAAARGTFRAKIAAPQRAAG